MKTVSRYKHTPFVIIRETQRQTIANRYSGTRLKDLAEAEPIFSTLMGEDV